MTATTQEPASASTPSAAAATPRILVLGGGYVGLYTALGLKKALKPGEARVTVVDPRPYMTYQPFLPEVAAGSIEARHVVVSLRGNLKREGFEVVTGAVTGVDHAARTATVQPPQGEELTLHYDQVVVGLGSISRVLPIPGLAEVGIGFKTVEEAAAVRDHVLDRLDAAASMPDGPERRRALTFVFVGGGYAGIEALAEVEDLLRSAVDQYTTLDRGDLNVVLVEALNRILPEVGEQMGRWTLQQLRDRDIDCRLETFLKACEGGHVVLSDGTEFDADTIVWTAGVKANPMLGRTDLPLDDKGRLICKATLQVDGVEGAWSAGDCAAVPDLTQPGRTTGPSAQHAVRQTKTLAANIVATVRRGTLSDYRHKYAGSVASLGLYRGVAEIYGVKLRGLPAWFMHRTYHLSRVPTLNRKVRVLADWTLAIFFPREVVSLGQLQQPRREFELAALPNPGRAPLPGVARETG
jgi:NADH dehydrogenase